MHLLVDITAHGFGHLAQTAPVLDALRARLPHLRLTVRSAIPRERLALRITGEFAHIEEARDFGFVMHNAIDIDFVASETHYRNFHADWEQRVADEADGLRRHGVDAVLANAAYLPLAAAARAGIPAAGLCSLNWADLFGYYFHAEPWAGDIHREILDAYNTAAGFLCVTPGMPMHDFARRHEIAPIAHVAPHGRHLRDDIARAMDLDPSRRWVLIAMGGMDLRLPLEDWPRMPGISWLVPAAWQVRREDVRAIENAGHHFTDLLASVDAVITKPGYGTFAEAAYNGVPVLYVAREDWPETAHLATWLHQHGRAAATERERLLAGDIDALLDTLWRTPAPPLPRADGAEQAATWLAEHLR